MALRNKDNYMVDGYLGGVNSVARASDISSTSVPIKETDYAMRNESYEYNARNGSRQPKNSTLADDVSIKLQTKNSHPKKRSIERDCNGLTIIPWEEFLKGPKRLNELFYLESNGFITYDPDDVNVFFHATRMNRPTFGDISENGRAWILTVEKREELDYLRKWLTERVSVFGVTLVKKGKRFSKSQRAPYLVTLNPKHGSLGEQINSALTRSIARMKENKKFCIEININGCVERWSQDVMDIQCRAVGARLIITNGEERDKFGDLEDIICCVACFPIWGLQTAIYKIHRRSAYTDHMIDLGTETIHLHGCAGSVDNQRQKLFRDYERGDVFRTKPDENGISQMADNALDADAYKYICVKKYERKEGEETKTKLVEYETTNLQNLISKKIVKEEIKIAIEQSDNFHNTNNVTDDAKFNAFVQQAVPVEYHTDEYKRNTKQSPDQYRADDTFNQIQLDAMSTEKKGLDEQEDEGTEIHSFREDTDDNNELDPRKKVKHANWNIDGGQINGEPAIISNIPPSDTIKKQHNGSQNLNRNHSKVSSSFRRQMPIVKEGCKDVENVSEMSNKNAMEPSDSDDSSDTHGKESSASVGRYDVAAMLKNRHLKPEKVTKKKLMSYDHDDFAFAKTDKDKNSKNSPENDKIDPKNAILIPVSKSDDTHLVDTTDFADESKILNDNDMLCCDVEDLDDVDNETSANTSHKNLHLQTNERRRRRPQYDSRRKYLGVPMPKKQTKTAVSAQNSPYADVNL